MYNSALYASSLIFNLSPIDRRVESVDTQRRSSVPRLTRFYFTRICDRRGRLRETRESVSDNNNLN